jgi:hypothetical protein
VKNKSLSNLIGKRPQKIFFTPNPFLKVDLTPAPFLKDGGVKSLPFRDGTLGIVNDEYFFPFFIDFEVFGW